MKRMLIIACAVALLGSAAMAVDFQNRSLQCAPNQTVFVTGFQRYAKLNDGRPHTSYEGSSVAVGYIWAQNNWKAGAALSWEHSERRYSDRNGNATVRGDTPGVSLFGKMDLQDNWYVEADTFLGFRDQRMKRISTNAGPIGNSDRIDKTVFAMSVEGGKDFMLGQDFFLTPHLGLAYAYTPTETYSLTGGRTSIDSQSYWEIPVGVSLKKEIAYGDWVISPNVDATLVNSIGGMDAKNAQPGFAYRGMDSWKVAGIGGSHLGARLSAGIDASISSRTSLGLDYTYETRKNYNDHRVSAMFGVSF